MDTPEQKEQLRKLVTRLYNECGQELEPLYPKILIRVLPKEQQKGTIWLPDNKQNKPNWEGLVLKVYKPFYQKIYLSEANWVADDPDPEVRYVQKVECVLKPGDHILFPHIEFGQVPTPLDEGKGDYRMIPENIVLGTVEYARESIVDELTDYFQECGVQSYPESATKGNVKEFLKKYDVIRKDVGSLTLSGA